MDEFKELTKDAPKFEQMERGELVAYTYGLLAAGNKVNAENVELKEELENVRKIMADELEKQVRDYRARHIEQTKTVVELELENERLREYLGGGSIVTDYWKDGDGAMHVLTTDGEFTYEYQRGGLAEENAKLRSVVKAAWGCVNRAVDCHECRLVCGGCTLLSAMKDCGIEVN